MVLFKICFIAYIYLSIFIYLSESLAWACCSLVLGFAASWIITLSSCPSIQPWERGEVLITFRRLYVCSYLWEQHQLAECCTSSPGQVCQSKFHLPCTQWLISASSNIHDSTRLESIDAGYSPCHRKGDTCWLLQVWQVHWAYCVARLQCYFLQS